MSDLSDYGLTLEDWRNLSPRERVELSRKLNLMRGTSYVRCEECAEPIHKRSYVDESLPGIHFCSPSHLFLYKDAMSARAGSEAIEQAQIPTTDYTYIDSATHVSPEQYRERAKQISYSLEEGQKLLTLFYSLPRQQRILIRNLMIQLSGASSND